jgi:predicted DNA-binding transcriptional regulator YafY
MGTRSATESLATIVTSFLTRRTWQQAELARHVDIGVPALRKHLLSLQAAGIPLTDEREPPHVYWSVPKTWFPGGVLIPSTEVETLLRHLARLPRSKDRDRLLRLVVEATQREPPSVVPRDSSDGEERHLAVIENAAAQRKPLRFRYYSASRGSDGLREASVHRVFVGPPARFIATCHRSGALKWFRVDNVTDSGVEENGTFRKVEAGELDDVLVGSLEGFMGEGPREAHSFFVREPDARSVVKNLLAGMQVEDARGGVRIRIETTALLRLARYVVGLGAAATAETESLRVAVRELASGALKAND